LREEEDDVRREIEATLEKENLDRERGEHPGGAEAMKSSVSLLGDLEEIQYRAERHQRMRQSRRFPEVEAKGEAVVSCYKWVYSYSIYRCTDW
jgi:altered-inheritance-of-mitochondria protein 13